MSKITAKNLQYNSSLPPFLARLRGEAGGDRGGPDPILAAQRRAIKKRSGSAEAEDAPLVVDEHGNTVDVSIGADGVVTEQHESAAAVSAPATANNDKSGGYKPAADTDGAAVVAGEKLVDATSQRKKRKAARVIGADADEDDAGKDGDKNRASKTQETEGQADGGSAAKPKGKKKAKKIKLSFGDDEG
ncbi:hypothetical protein BT67DRAFT_387652 [Trichocladium antarcticum]|uniref:DUF4604 domain-containing protein n=1 Tax=Trichocladium antarcticum TaxID=1450529 RepID=A0AAN6ZBB6_9PEZI|nr:hypothetical protein BT67DRAFT_387652 [Trichocladium antarcticum]